MAKIKGETIAILAGAALVAYAVAPGIKKFFDKTGEAGTSVANAAEGASMAVQGLGSGIAQVSTSSANVAKEIGETINAPLNLLQQLYSDVGEIATQAKQGLLGSGSGGGSKNKPNIVAPAHAIPSVMVASALTYAPQGSSAAQQMQAVINPATTLVGNLLGVKSNVSTKAQVRTNLNTVLYTGSPVYINAPGVLTPKRTAPIMSNSVLKKY